MFLDAIAIIFYFWYFHGRLGPQMVSSLQALDGRSRQETPVLNVLRVSYEALLA